MEVNCTQVQKIFFLVVNFIQTLRIKDNKREISMKQQVELTAHFSKTTDSKRIKGFASMNNRDRHDHIVPPESFDIDRFMNNPQLKYNHNYYKDENGNQIPIGKVLEAQVAVVRDIGNSSVWGIFDTEDKQIDTFDKQISPDCYHGCRGLWIKAEVTVESVWNQIIDGDFNAFSWQGLAKFAKISFAGVTRMVSKYIDLYECSCVFIPDNYSATFELSKSADMQKDVDPKVFANVPEQLNLVEMKPHQVMFSKDIFEDKEKAVSWLAEKGMVDQELEEVNGEYVATFIPKDKMTEGIYTMQFATGVQLSMGFAEEDIKSPSAELEILELTKSVTEDIQMKKTSKSGAKVTAKASSGEVETSTVVEDEATLTKDAEVAEVTEESTQETAEATTEETTEEVAEQAEEQAEEKAEEKAEEEAELEKTTEEGAEKTAEAEEAELEKGVKEELDAMNQNKWERLAPVYKAMQAFEEAAWASENVPSELTELVKEFATIVMGEAEMIKTTEVAEEPNFAVELIATKAAEKVLETVDSKFGEITELIKSLQPKVVENEEEVEGTAEVSKTAESENETETKVAELIKSVGTLESQLADAKGQIATMSKSVASPSVDRLEDHEVEVSKSVDDDPNSCFGSVDNWNKAFGFK